MIFLLQPSLYRTEMKVRPYNPCWGMGLIKYSSLWLLSKFHHLCTQNTVYSLENRTQTLSTGSWILTWNHESCLLIYLIQILKINYIWTREVEDYSKSTKIVLVYFNKTCTPWALMNFPIFTHVSADSSLKEYLRTLPRAGQVHATPQMSQHSLSPLFKYFKSSSLEKMETEAVRIMK